MSAFDPAYLRLIADGDADAQAKFIHTVTKQCHKLVRSHLESWGRKHETALVGKTLQKAFDQFFQQLENEGIPAQPKVEWFRTLVRTLLIELRPVKAAAATK